MKHRKAYMRLVEPGKKTETKTSPLFQKYVAGYLKQINQAVEKGKSADEAFKTLPSVSNLTPGDLINLLWENQHLGTWDIPKGSTNLYYALEGILQKAIRNAAIQWWGQQKTERKRITDPSKETVVKSKEQDETVTKVETPKKGSSFQVVGRVYRKAQEGKWILSVRLEDSVFDSIDLKSLYSDLRLRARDRYGAKTRYRSSHDLDLFFDSIQDADDFVDTIYATVDAYLEGYEWSDGTPITVKNTWTKGFPIVLVYGPETENKKSLLERRQVARVRGASMRRSRNRRFLRQMASRNAGSDLELYTERMTEAEIEGTDQLTKALKLLAQLINTVNIVPSELNRAATEEDILMELLLDPSLLTQCSYLADRLSTALSNANEASSSLIDAHEDLMEVESLVAKEKELQTLPGRAEEQDYRAVQSSRKRR